MFSTNNNNIQVNVKGWKQISSSSGITLKTNGILGHVKVEKSSVTQGAWSAVGSIDSTYAPEIGIRFNKQFADSETDNTHLYLESNGNIGTPGALSNKNIKLEAIYKLKNIMY